jgi:hypothetical protein
LTTTGCGLSPRRPQPMGVGFLPVNEFIARNLLIFPRFLACPEFKREPASATRFGNGALENSPTTPAASSDSNYMPVAPSEKAYRKNFDAEIRAQPKARVARECAPMDE